MPRKETKPEVQGNGLRDLELLPSDAAELLKALSHETRLAIVCLIARKEKSVTEIQEALGLPQATISQHLGRLRRAKVIVGLRRGRSVHYVANSERLGPLFKSLHSSFSGSA
jgi:DNA-binding transcriptional ArsR family regulator